MDQRLINYTRQNNARKLEKNKMATVVYEIWTNTDIQVITNGFKKVDIHPINKHTVPREKFYLLALQ